MACQDAGSFRESLLKVSDGLNDDDLLHLTHLCRDVITRKEADSISSGCDLFELLETKGKLSPDYRWFLADLLIETNHIALLDHIGLDGVTKEEHETRRCQIRPYRLYLTRLAMELDDKDFLALKSACDCHKEEITHFYQLVMYLENHGKISAKSKTGIGFLIKAFEKAGLTDAKRHKNVQLLLETFRIELETENLCYRMTSRPKGICVIINNEGFPGKKRRAGSKADAGKLERLFNILSFKVIVYHDLTSTQIVSRLQEVSRLDHWRYDCFVCCVLSHGSLGRVFGVDDVAVTIKHLLNIFSINNCPSLEGKPKVYFLQACQGEKCEKGPSRSSTQVSSPECNSDAEIDDLAPHPSDLEQDLLLGYATPPGYKSYRNVQEGSWYIQELVNSLKDYAKTEDILSILTKVNADVAKKEGTENSISVKQTPYPTFTLAKTLYLG